jgi:hypothetical protein
MFEGVRNATSDKASPNVPREADAGKNASVEQIDSVVMTAALYHRLNAAAMTVRQFALAASRAILCPGRTNPLTRAP